jgi:hypothetical protein
MLRAESVEVRREGGGGERGDNCEDGDTHGGGDFYITASFSYSS